MDWEFHHRQFENQQIGVAEADLVCISYKVYRF